MKLLLDTHLLLWALLKPTLLPPQAAELITSAANDVYCSAASIWEIAIKSALGRDAFPPTPHVIHEASLAAGFQPLAISAEHAAVVFELQGHHRDPFDRLLIAQARCENALLLTSDALLARYGDHVRIV